VNPDNWRLLVRLDYTPCGLRCIHCLVHCDYIHCPILFATVLLSGYPVTHVYRSCLRFPLLRYACPYRHCHSAFPHNVYPICGCIPLLPLPTPLLPCRRYPLHTRFAGYVTCLCSHVYTHAFGCGWLRSRSGAITTLDFVGYLPLPLPRSRSLFTFNVYGVCVAYGCTTTCGSPYIMPHYHNPATHAHSYWTWDVDRKTHVPFSTCFEHCADMH